jgi:hypothetical protein
MSSKYLETISAEIEFNTGKKINIPEMKFNGLTVIVGQNGTGKTMALKVSWFVMYLLYNYRAIALLAPESLQEIVERDFPLISKTTFGPEDFMKFRATINGTWGSKYEMTLQIENNELKQFNIEIEDPEEFLAVGIGGIPQFNSKQCRTFDAYERYLDILEITGLHEFRTYEDALKLYKHFKLYDIIWMENVRKHVRDIEENPEEFNRKPSVEYVTYAFMGQNPSTGNEKEVLTAEWKNFKGFTAKDEIPYVILGDDEIPLSKLSDGEQALIMMSIFN